MKYDDRVRRSLLRCRSWRTAAIIALVWTAAARASVTGPFVGVIGETTGIAQLLCDANDRLCSNILPDDSVAPLTGRSYGDVAADANAISDIEAECAEFSASLDFYSTTGIAATGIERVDTFEDPLTSDTLDATEGTSTIQRIVSWVFTAMARSATPSECGAGYIILDLVQR